MNTNRKEMKTRLRAYLIENIATELNECETDQQIIFDLLERFHNEFNNEHEKKKNISLQGRLATWLSWLPTALPFKNYEILEDAKVLHQVESFTEKKEDSILNTHWNFWAWQILQYAQHLKIELSKYY